LGRLYVRLETNAFSEQADVDQALRRLWGSVYTGFGGGKAAGLVEFAELALRNGLMRLRQQHIAQGTGSTASEQQRQSDIASTMQELAGVLLIRRRLPEAEAMCREALAMRQTATGTGSLASADSRVLLARILLARGQMAQAMAEADAATNQLRNLPGPGGDALLASMIAVKARVELDNARGEQAEPLIREALVRRLSSLPTEDPELLDSLGQLAELAELMPDCKTVQELTEALGPSTESLAAVLRADLPVLRSANRNTFPNVVRTRRPAALARLVKIQAAMVGPDDLSLVGTLMAHVAATEREGVTEGATAEACLRAAAILSKRYGPTDPSQLFCIDKAAAAYAFLGPASRAVELGRRTYAIFDAIPSDCRDHLLAANSKRWLAWFLALDEKYQESLEMHRAAIAELEPIVGKRHHVVAIAQSGMAFCLWHLGHTAEAETLSAGALEMAKDLPALPFDQLAHMRFVRGHILCAQLRDVEAEPMMNQAWDVVFRCGGRGFVWRKILISDMIALAERRADTATAAYWREQETVDCGTEAPGR
jgi:tetratricopeptide (TPR) repeat protein